MIWNFVRVQNLNQAHFAKTTLAGVAEEQNREIKAVTENGKVVEVQGS